MKQITKHFLVLILALTLLGACAVPTWATAETDKYYEQILAETPEDAYLYIAVEINSDMSTDINALRRYMKIENPVVRETFGDSCLIVGYATSRQIRQITLLPPVRYLGICRMTIEPESGKLQPGTISIAPRYSTILGDVDLNGMITARDARLALRASAKLEKLSPIRFFTADLDGNGRITAGEARKILHVSAGLDTFA